MRPFRCRTTALSVFGCALALLVLSSAAEAQLPATQSRAGAQAAASTAAGRAAVGPGYVGQDACLSCHQEGRTRYLNGTHARALDPRTPAAAGGCEACHGPGQAHVEGAGDKTKIKRLALMSAEEVNDTCMSCHERGDRAGWTGSAHDARKLSCVTCHSAHSPKSEKSQLKTTTQMEACASCHRDQTAKARRSAHMPVREGNMECSSCHNPHGSTTNVKMLRIGDSVNESCVSCHTEKRGPYLYEHAPTNEGCATCHDPHGSNNERMLVAKQPMLCQRCHIASRHPATIYDANNARTSNRAFGRSCVQCHQQIHGSNHPAGNFFVR